MLTPRGLGAAGRWAAACAVWLSRFPAALASRLAGHALRSSSRQAFRLASGAGVTPLLHGGAAGPAATQEAELPPGVPVTGRQLASLLRVRRGRGHSFRAAQRGGAAEPCVVTELKDLYGTEYAGPIGIGTTEGADGKLAPQAELRVIYDTGSADFWVASDLCERFPCTLGGHRRFNHTQSTTFRSGTSLVQVSSTYGSGTLRGQLGEDDVRLGALTVKRQKIGLVSEEMGKAFEMSFDGIVGLGFPSLSNATATPLFDNLVAQGKIATPEFAFYLHRRPERGGAVLWGNTDSRLYHGSLSWFPVVEESYWALELVSIQVGNRTFVSPESAADDWTARLHDGLLVTPFNPLLIVDSGTTFYSLGPEAFGIVMDQAGARPCDQLAGLPPVVFTLRDSIRGLQDFAVPAEEYMVRDGLSDETCYPGFVSVGRDEAMGKDFVILGELFMRYHFTVFSREGAGGAAGARVGVARADHSMRAHAVFADAGVPSLGVAPGAEA